MAVRKGFVAISLDKYVELHVQHNPGTHRDELVGELQSVLAAHRQGVRCRCGQPLWLIGSSQVGAGCFTCITGEAHPDEDYEIDLDM